MDDLWVRKPAPVRAVRWFQPGDAACFGARVMEFGGDVGKRFIVPTTLGQWDGEPGDWIVEGEGGALVRMSHEQFTHLHERYDPRPCFKLKPTDPLTPATVRFWIAQAEASGVPEYKIDSARNVIEQIERTPGPRHLPD